ncbi:hypothetical protein WHR41_00525 [Cladosporium halotolerans]|uniref:Uncharacterized protein n=1 Tax=Cladosporium halotolerans TaxID=1052096 RepID=A0AB34L6Y6_9PEZI
MRSSLSVNPTPFRSSHLSIPTSPFTPQLPITPPPSRPQTKPTTAPQPPLSPPPPPQEPLRWLWQCHCCSRIYHLGTTRRCLDDGHYFCAGAPVTKRDRKTGLRVTRKSRACASEFDYQGWKAWGAWRRDVGEQRRAAAALTAVVEGDEKIEDVATAVPRPLFAPDEGAWFGGVFMEEGAASEQAFKRLEKDCWNTCDYPSECRWGKQFGAHQTQVQSQAAVAVAVVSPPPPPPPPTMVAEPAAKDLERPGRSYDGLSSIPATIEEVSETESEAHAHGQALTAAQETTKKPTFDDLLASAKRRKRRSTGPPPSPLASNPPSPTEGEAQQVSANTFQKAFDDFELDVRESIGRAGVLLNDFVHGLRGSGALEDEKAELFVKGLKPNSKKKSAEDQDQSLSD